MNITITTVAAVLVDGKNYGSVADTIANNRQLAPDVQRALVAYEAERAAALATLSAHRDRLASVIATAGEFIAKGNIEGVVAMWQDGQKSAAQLELEALAIAQAELDAKREALQKVLE